MISVVPAAQPTGFLGAGIISGFQTPSSFNAAAMAAQQSLGPVTTQFSSMVGALLPNQISAAMQGGFDELSDQSSDRQMNPIGVPMRVRASRLGDYQRTLTIGTPVFASLLSSTASADKHTLLSIPALNIEHQKRAYADARVAAGQAIEGSETDASVLRALTARTPSAFAEMWGFSGCCMEASGTNATAAEPLWTVSVPGAGRVLCSNIFGHDVQLWDELYLIVELVQPVVERSANPHAPQPANILRIRGAHRRGQMHRMTSTTPEPAAGDIDCVERDARLQQTWTRRVFNTTTNSWDESTVANLGNLASSALRVDRYTHGYAIKVGHCVDQFPANANQTLVAAAHTSIAAFQKLPTIGIAPFQQRR